ncbi:MAG: hypothetical protein ABGY96_12370 [bacterium]
MLGRPLVDPEVEREIHLVRMPGRKMTPVATAFMQEVSSFDWH